MDEFQLILDSWPPSFTQDQIQEIVVDANSFALARGLAYLPPDFGTVPTSALHAPFTLVPSPFPKYLFELAQSLQPIYNRLYSYIACHTLLLDQVLGDETGIGRVDPFTGKLWRGWKNLRDRDAIRQVSVPCPLRMYSYNLSVL